MGGVEGKPCPEQGIGGIETSVSIGQLFRLSGRDLPTGPELWLKDGNGGGEF